MKQYFAKTVGPGKIDFVREIGRPAVHVYIRALEDSVVRFESPGFMPISLGKDDELEVKDDEGIHVLFIESGRVEVLAR